MRKRRLEILVEECDPEVRLIVTHVLKLEQELISLDRPHVKTRINNVVEMVARDRLDKNGGAEKQ